MSGIIGVWGYNPPHPKIVYKEKHVSTFLDEIKTHPVMVETMKRDPKVGMAYITYFTKKYNEEWNDFIQERERFRLIDKEPTGVTSDMRQVACAPGFITAWLKFINVGKEPTKQFTRKFFKEHPVFWVRDNAFSR